MRSFAVVAEEGSISRAAVRLHLSQQSLSQQIRSLERDVGAEVLHRSSQGVTLTAVGEILLREGLPLLGAGERLTATVGRRVRGEGVALRAGFLSSLANEVMPAVLTQHATRCPEVELGTADLPIADLVAGLREGRLDVAVGRPPLVDDVVTHVLGSEPVVIALPAGHRLAAAPRLTLADLANENWVLTPRSSWAPWHRKYDADFRAAGYEPRVVQRSTSPQGLLALVAAGVGITRLAASAQSLRSGGVHFVELDGERAVIALLTPPGPLSPAGQQFRATVRAALEAELPDFRAA
nr:LysR family transcriptional regulator [Kineosporia rhizophila]